MAVLKKHRQVDEATLNSLPLAIVLFDNIQVYFLNKEAQRILGISAKQIKSSRKLSIYNLVETKFH